MFEIDYNLIPLSDQDRLQVERKVTHELAKGVTPKLSKKSAGRLVVLNPDPVQTSHHIPDDLRSYLRRMMVHTFEGPFDLRPDKLLEALKGAEDPIHVLIVELKSRFTHFGGFLKLIPRLRDLYPDIGIFLSADQPAVIAKIQGVMKEQGASLQMTYPDGRGMVELQDPAELDQVASEQVAPVALSVPFFTQIRLNIGEGGKPVPYNLDTLRKLHSRFGHGPIKDVDMGGGRKEKMVVLDLPSRLIRDFQFRQDRGLDFHGIIQGGRTILSRYFEKEKLEFRWIPFRSLDAFIQKAPGEPETRVPVPQTTLLRVNCFNGQTTFVLRSATDQISLDDVKYLGFRWPPAGEQPGGGGEAGKPVSQTAETGSATTRLFDGLILPGPASGALDRVQQAVMDHVYRSTLRGSAERARKLEIFTSHLKVGAVGPLAAQTLKIFRRYGLEGLIAPGSFHYLCDLPQQLPTYYKTTERFEENFAGALAALRSIMDEGNGGSIRIGDYTHNLPVTMEWIDNPDFEFRHAAPMEMGVVFNEMQSLEAFIGHEFRRNFEIGEQDIVFFEKIADCKNAGLLVKWMEDFKNGAYGSTLPEDDFPDFVFFGTPADKIENDQQFFFPNLACSEIFQQPETQKLFAGIDFGFSVFLEQQIALADHAQRDQSEGNLGDYGKYFEKKTEEARAALQELHAAREAIDATETPEFLAMLKEEEEGYHERFRAFVQARDKAVAGHRAVAEAFLRDAAELAEVIPLKGTPPEDWFSGTGADPHAFGLGFLESVRNEAAARKMVLERKAEEVMGTFRNRLTVLSDSLRALEHTITVQKQWQETLGANILATQARSLQAKAGERFQALRRLGDIEKEGHRHRIRTQLTEIRTDGERMELRAEQHEKRTGQTLRSMRDVMDKLLKGFDSLVVDARRDGVGEGHVRLENFLARLERVLGTMQTLAGKLEQSSEQYKQLLARKTRLSSHLHSLRVDALLVEASVGQTPPQMPETATEEEEAHLKARAEALRSQYLEHKQQAGGMAERFKAAPAELGGLLRPMAPEMRSFRAIQEAKANLEKSFARKGRELQSVAALKEREKLMEADLADLPRKVREKFMPARKELLLRVFIPEAEKKITQFQRSQMLFQEIQRFHEDILKSLYLDRAVHRRFSSNQFLRGAYVAIGTQSTRGKTLRNVLPAVNYLQRNLHYNYAKQHGKKAEVVSLRHLKSMEMGELREFIRNQLADDQAGDYDYLVLPSTLELEEAVELMNKKMELTHGVPRLVLIYVSKFDATRIMADARLRVAYFKAQQHNVIVNIDGYSVVDNPHSIGFRLLQETLGSTFDTGEVEDMEDDDEKANIAFKV